MSERFVNTIVIHCAASPNGAPLFEGKLGDAGFKTPDQVIDGWHVKRGFRRGDEARKRFNPGLGAIGYHFLIGLNGALYTGRHLDEIGAHAAGNNKASIGICVLGTDRFSQAQWERLAGLVGELRDKYTIAGAGPRILGHRDLSPDADGDGEVEPHEWLKICPGFDVAAWLANDMRPDPAHVFDPQPPAAAMKAAA
jgi:hypothetical protein